MKKQMPEGGWPDYVDQIEASIRIRVYRKAGSDIIGEIHDSFMEDGQKRYEIDLEPADEDGGKGGSVLTAGEAQALAVLMEKFKGQVGAWEKELNEQL
jgi:hypothetical protein